MTDVTAVITDVAGNDIGLDRRDERGHHRGHCRCRWKRHLHMAAVVTDVMAEFTAAVQATTATSCVNTIMPNSVLRSQSA